MVQSDYALHVFINADSGISAEISENFYSAFTETRATQTVKTNQMAEPKQ